MKEKISITSPAKCLPFLQVYTKKKQEHFVVLLLNGAHEVICKKLVAMGTANRCAVHPRDVFREAIRKNACAIIIAHNHPSDHVESSLDDIQLTQGLADAGKLLGISVLDHIIISRTQYFSFVEHDVMPN